jgi:hypothetical protein
MRYIPVPCRRVSMMAMSIRSSDMLLGSACASGRKCSDRKATRAWISPPSLPLCLPHSRVHCCCCCCSSVGREQGQGQRRGCGDVMRSSPALPPALPPASPPALPPASPPALPPALPPDRLFLAAPGWLRLHHAEEARARQAPLPAREVPRGVPSDHSHPERQPPGRRALPRCRSSVRAPRSHS